MVQFYQRVSKVGLRKLEPATIDLHKNRILFCLPGSGTSSIEAHQWDMKLSEPIDLVGEEKNFHRFASGMLKIANRALGGREEIPLDVRVVLTSYLFDPYGTMRLDNNKWEYNYKNPEHFDIDADQFVREVKIYEGGKGILNLIADDPIIKGKLVRDENGKIKKVGEKLTGKKLPMETLEANMSRLCFLAYSHGTVFSGEICNAMKKYMRDLKYEEADIKRALSKVNVVAVASVMQTKNPDNMYFNIVHFQGKDDLAIQRFVPEFKKDIGEKGPFYIEKIRDNVLRVICETKKPYGT